MASSRLGVLELRVVLRARHGSILDDRRQKPAQSAVTAAVCDNAVGRKAARLGGIGTDSDFPSLQFESHVH